MPTLDELMKEAGALRQQAARPSRPQQPQQAPQQPVQQAPAWGAMRLAQETFERHREQQRERVEELEGQYGLNRPPASRVPNANATWMLKIDSLQEELDEMRAESRRKDRLIAQLKDRLEEMTLRENMRAQAAQNPAQNPQRAEMPQQALREHLPHPNAASMYGSPPPANQTPQRRDMGAGGLHPLTHQPVGPLSLEEGMAEALSFIRHRVPRDNPAYFKNTPDQLLVNPGIFTNEEAARINTSGGLLLDAVGSPMRAHAAAPPAPGGRNLTPMSEEAAPPLARAGRDPVVEQALASLRPSYNPTAASAAPTPNPTNDPTPGTELPF